MSLRNADHIPVPHWDHAHQTVPVDEDVAGVADVLAQERAESYLAGRTHEEIHKEDHSDAADTFRSGTIAEVAVAQGLFLPILDVIDIEISDEGDDGSDLALNDQHNADVKTWEAPPTRGTPRLLVETGKLAGADCYILTQVWGDENQRHVAIHGWVTAAEVLEKGRIETERWDNVNYVVEIEDLRPPETLHDWAGETPF